MTSEENVPVQPEPPPPAGEQPQPGVAPAAEPAQPPAKEGEDAFKEPYEEVMEPEKPQKPRKNRHWGAIITVVIIIVILIVWTLLSPKMLPVEGMTYVDSETYASLGNFTGFRDIWTGNTTWGLSISGASGASVGQAVEFKVLFTKVAEKTGNFFFKGNAITLENVSIFNGSGEFLGKMTSHRSVGYGEEAVVPVTFAQAKSYELYVTAKFTVYEDMRIGFFPVESVNVPAVYFDDPYPVAA